MKTTSSGTGLFKASCKIPSMESVVLPVIFPDFSVHGWTGRFEIVLGMLLIILSCVGSVH